MSELHPLEHHIGFEFHEPELLQRALTHRSFINEKTPEDEAADHNERLEFLGDAVLDFITGDWLYRRFPTLREGELTRLRALLVRTETLADFALDIGVDQSLRMGHGEAETGGHQRPSNLCDAFEAIIGAIYLDRGLDAVREFIIPKFEGVLSAILQKDSTKDAKSRLQEWSQSQPDRVTPTYYTIAEFGPDHAKWFTIEVRLGGKTIGWGNGRSKRLAEHAAAQSALLELNASDLDALNR